MPYEAARQLLSNRIADLQTTLDASNSKIASTEKELAQAKAAKEELLVVIRETAGALASLGGPVPDWTDDMELISFWDEVKDS